MSKPVTPVRLSRSGRTRAGGEEHTVTASMELLPPEAACSPTVSTTFHQAGDLAKRESQDLMAMGAPASLHAASRTGSMRRTSSAHHHHHGGQLSSTRPADPGALQGQPVGALLLQLPISLPHSEHSTSRRSMQLLSQGLQQDAQGHVMQLQTSFQHSTSKRYSENITSGGGTTTGGDVCGVHVSSTQGQPYQHSRPGSVGSTTSSMLIGGVPGPLPATTPGVLSRLWTPESYMDCMDDSANTQAPTTAGMGLGLGGTVQTQASDSVVLTQGCSDADVADTPPEGLGQPNHVEFYELLHSRRTTSEGVDAHAFTVPEYPDLAASTVSMSRLDHHQDEDNDLDDVASQPPGTPHSVASGVVRRSNVFFTALRHSVGGDVMQEASMLSVRSAAPTEAMSLISRANPMEEPSIALTEQDSATIALMGQPGTQASALDGGNSSDYEARDGVGSQDGEVDEYLAAYAAGVEESKSVWDNPVQTPRETSTAAPTAEPSRASFLSLLRDLYDDSPDEVHAMAAEGDNPQQDEETNRPGSTQEGEEVHAGSDSLRSSMTDLQQTEEQQATRRQELNEYISSLQSKVCENGQLLVELPKNYQVLVQQLLMSKRAEYASLAGWLGPRRFQDLPISNLPDAHEDPKVAEGLIRIKALDAKLAEQEAALLILAREKDPEAWAVQERARLQRQAAAVEAALKRERMKHMRKAQLSRALSAAAPEATDSSTQAASAARASTALSTTSSVLTAGGGQRLPALRPDEEALVEAVLKRSDQEEEANPFELQGSACLPPDPADCVINPGMSRPSSALGLKGGGVKDLQPAVCAGAVQLPNGSAGVLAGVPGQAVGLLSREGSVLVEPLGLSTGALLGEASAAALLQKAHEVAMELAGQPRTPTSQQAQAQQGGGGGEGEGAGAGSVHASVDLAAGLAVHTRALLRAQQAAVAGMSLADINTHLDRFAGEHTWFVDGSLADFSSLSAKAHSTQVLAQPASVPGTSGPQSNSQQDNKARVASASSSATARRAPPAEPPAHSAGRQHARAAAAKPKPQPSLAPSQAAGSIIGGPGGKRDYLREEREAKELAQREVDLDSRIRAFKTSDPAGKPLSPMQLAALVSECRQLLHRAAAISVQANPGVLTTQRSSTSEAADRGAIAVEPSRSGVRSSSSNSTAASESKLCRQASNVLPNGPCQEPQAAQHISGSTQDPLPGNQQDELKSRNSAGRKSSGHASKTLMTVAVTTDTRQYPPDSRGAGNAAVSLGAGAITAVSQASRAVGHLDAEPTASPAGSASQRQGSTAGSSKMQRPVSGSSVQSSSGARQRL